LGNYLKEKKMSTPAIIKLEGYKNIVLYKHCDGDPQSTMKWLQDFNKNFVKNRGDDNNYKFAQLVRSSAFDCEEYGLDNNRYTGWGKELENESNKH